MPTRFLSDAELAQLSGFPTEIAAEDLVTYFRLEESDRRWLIGEHRGAANRLGLGLQLCILAWLGFVPDDLTRCRQQRWVAWPISLAPTPVCWATTADGRTVRAPSTSERSWPGSDGGPPGPAR